MADSFCPKVNAFSRGAWVCYGLVKMLNSVEAHEKHEHLRDRWASSVRSIFSAIYPIEPGMLS